MSSCTIDEYDGTISVVQSVWTAVQWRGGGSISRQISNFAIPHPGKKLVLKQNLEQNTREKKKWEGFEPGAYAWLRQLYTAWLPQWPHEKIF